LGVRSIRERSEDKDKRNEKETKGNERGGGQKIRKKEKDRKMANGFRKRKAVKGHGNG
jgi:hypothetical protein